jgi:hypothetical protein
MTRATAFSADTIWAPAHVWETVFAHATDTFIGIVLLLMGLPETVVEKIYWGEVPLQFIVFYLALACAFVEFALAGSLQRGRSRELGIATLLMAIMATMGFLKKTEFKWWVVDVSMFSGFLLGLYWGKKRSIARASRVMCRWNMLCTLLLLVNVIGLAAGLISPANNSNRIYTSALFDCVKFVSMSIPFCFAVMYCQRSRRSRCWMVLILCGWGLGVLGGAIVSATRSVLLVGLSSGVLTYWIAAKNRVLTGIFFVLLTIVAWFLLLGDNTGGLSQTLLVDRLFHTDIYEECRYAEVAVMFDDMRTSTDVWLGKGFGSRFWSNLRLGDETMAFAPHIAVLTAWYKGGLLSFFIVIVCPALLAVYRLFMHDRSAIQSACYAGVIVYLLMSSLSGGWHFIMLFAYGAFFALSKHDCKVFAE